MFINDIHIMWYVGAGFLGIIVGILAQYLNNCLSEHKPILSANNIKLYYSINGLKFALPIITCAVYVLILLCNGVSDIVKLVQLFVISPMLLSVFAIDWKKQIIPTRLILTMIETGVVFSFIRGFNNLNVAVDMWLGMILGAGAFLALTLLGNLLFKKETMGYGDVKLMGILGLFFGWREIIVIAVLSFFIAAIYSIFLILKGKIKKQNLIEFIPFGPFIVLASFIIMLVPFNILLNIPFIIFGFGNFKF